MKVTIRKRQLKNNRTRLCLDIYPPIKNHTGKKSRFENLKLFIYDRPTTTAEKKHNRDSLSLAEQLRAKRELDEQMRIYGLSPDYKKQQSFSAYFRKLADRQRGMNYHNWDSAVRYFEKFTDRDVKFLDVDLSLCEDFKFYLRSGPRLRENRGPLQHNSALSYYNKFRNALKQAWREKLINDDLYALSPGLKEQEANVEFLTMTDLKMLVKVDVKDKLSRSVVLFALLTGLRFTDIKYLRWGDVRGEEGLYYLQFRQRKTLKLQHLPISDQAAELMGNRCISDAMVFPGIYYCKLRNFLATWPGLAGLPHHLTFSSLRHTYATLQLNSGTDIYTVSKMLGHRHLKTTQRYTRLLEEKKREATNRIVLEL